MDIHEIIEKVKVKLDALTLPDDINGSILFVVTGETGGSWQAVIGQGHISLTEGAPEKPSLTLTANAEVVTGLYEKTINPAMAFLTRKVKIDGDLTLLARLQGLFKN